MAERGLEWVDVHGTSDLRALSVQGVVTIVLFALSIVIALKSPRVAPLPWVAVAVVPPLTKLGPSTARTILNPDVRRYRSEVGGRIMCTTALTRSWMSSYLSQGAMSRFISSRRERQRRRLRDLRRLYR